MKEKECRNCEFWSRTSENNKFGSCLKIVCDSENITSITDEYDELHQVKMHERKIREEFRTENLAVMDVGDNYYPVVFMAREDFGCKLFKGLDKSES